MSLPYPTSSRSDGAKRTRRMPAVVGVAAGTADVEDQAVLREVPRREAILQLPRERALGAILRPVAARIELVVDVAIAVVVHTIRTFGAACWSRSWAWNSSGRKLVCSGCVEARCGRRRRRWCRTGAAATLHAPGAGQDQQG